MNKVSKIKAFTINEFYFIGAYCFHNTDSNFHFLLGKNGCSIIINTVLLDSLIEAQPSYELQFKLVQHGLANVSGRIAPSIETCASNKIKTTYFIIDITKQCNFDCVYCFRDLNNSQKINLSILQDICKYILDMAHKQQIDRINIQLWGGEPVMAMDRIEYVINYFQNTDVNVAMDLETNCSLITDEIAKQLYNWNINIGVSIDGTPFHQNTQRKLITGKDSMNMVIAGLQNIKRYYGNRFGGITVITKYNFRNIAEILEYFIYELDIKSMKFNIVRDNLNAKENSLGLTLEEVREFAESLCDAVELYNILGISFSEGNIQLRMDNLLERTNYSCCISNGCKGGQTLVSIDMKGDIFPCEMTDYPNEKIGSIYQVNSLYNEKTLHKQIDIAKNQNLFFVDKKGDNCIGCPWFYYCRGGCTSRIRYAGKYGVVDEVECELNKTIYPRLIQHILSSGNVNTT